MSGKVRYGIHFAILFLTFCMQCSPLWQQISVSGVVPDVVFVILFVYALYLKENEVITYAVIFGSFTDLIFGNVYGAVTLLYIGFVCLFFLLNRFIYSESFFTVASYCFASTLLYEGVMILISMAFRKNVGCVSELLLKMTVQCAYNAIFAIPVFAIARKIHIRKQEVR